MSDGIGSAKIDEKYIVRGPQLPVGPHTTVISCEGLGRVLPAGPINAVRAPVWARRPDYVGRAALRNGGDAIDLERTSWRAGKCPCFVHQLREGVRLSVVI